MPARGFRFQDRPRRDAARSAATVWGCETTAVAVAVAVTVAGCGLRCFAVARTSLGWDGGGSTLLLTSTCYGLTRTLLRMRMRMRMRRSSQFEQREQCEVIDPTDPR